MIAFGTFLSTYVTFDTGDLDKLSSLLYHEGEEYEGEEKISTNGYDTIANYLAEGLDIRLQQSVSKVDYTAEKVVVTANGVGYEADYVLVTVPLGVLKRHRIYARVTGRQTKCHSESGDELRQ